MNRMKLLGAAGLAASLMAAPAYAQNAGAGVGGNLNNPSSYGNGGNYGANRGGPYANAGGGGVSMAANGKLPFGSHRQSEPSSLAAGPRHAD